MIVTEIRSLFNQLIDEGTISFVDDADARGALKRAYKTFRRVVTDSDSWFYATTVDLTVAGSTYNLASGAVTVLGASPTATRLMKLLLIEVINSAGTSVGWLRPADQLEDIIVPWTTASLQFIGTYALKNSTLHFSNSYTGTLRLHYVPDSTVNWALDGPGDTQFIDDVPDDLQELIAYIAYTDYYAQRDGTPAIGIFERRRSLEGALRAHISGRHGSGAGVRDTFFGGW